MNVQARRQIHDALKLIESTRYRIGVNRFVHDFIDTWAFLQTGLYPPKAEMPDDLQSIAGELSHLLSKAMKIDPTSDVLGYVFCESGFYKQGTQFYPTPSEVAQLLSLLVGEGSSQESPRFYEPCCGSGINAIQWLEELLNADGESAVQSATLVLEDIDPLMVKACMLQLVHYYDSRQLSPRSMSIVAVDVITRAPKGISYYTQPVESLGAVAASASCNAV